MEELRNGENVKIGRNENVFARRNRIQDLKMGEKKGHLSDFFLDYRFRFQDELFLYLGFFLNLFEFLLLFLFPLLSVFGCNFNIIESLNINEKIGYM